MATVRLDTMGVIYNFEFEIQEEKQKAVGRAVIEFSGRNQKKGTGCILPIPLVVCGVPDGI